MLARQQRLRELDPSLAHLAAPRGSSVALCCRRLTQGPGPDVMFVPPLTQGALVENKRMHDWTLKSIEVNWESGTARLDLIASPGVTKFLTARNLVELVVSRRQEWGPSQSIMSSAGPLQRPDNNQQLEILLQSGDSLLIVAREITLPSAD